MTLQPASSHHRITHFIDHRQQGTYFTIPFTMPEGMQLFTLDYAYQRHRVENSRVAARKEINIIDLGLLAPDGSQVGASGSDKLSIQLSETHATPGYRPYSLVAGKWQIIVGAYKVAEEGVEVTYDLTFTPKHLRLLKGDLHTHTLASDGVLTLEELASHAHANGLDYLAVTDHNQMVSSDTLLEHPHLTLIPGIEWTHYQGHANFLGVDRPYDEPFFANTFAEVQQRFASARSRGACISINHPFDPVCPFLFDMASLPFDCLEVWNGPMRGSNLQAIGLWQSMLAAGKKVPICGGSDYHRDSLLLFPGGPTTCVYAMSPSPADILTALRMGHAFITYSANGPVLEMSAGEAQMGDSVPLGAASQVSYTARHLVAGDVVQAVTGNGSSVLVKMEADGEVNGEVPVSTPGFVRLEVLRSFLPGLPLLPAALSNPIYFDT